MTEKRSKTGSKLLAWSVLTAALLALPPFVQAQAPEGRAPGDSRPAAVHHFRIPASSLAEALTAFAMQSGLQVSFTRDTVRGLRAPELDGDYAPTEALEFLLQGTSLDYAFVNESTIVIRRPETPATTGDAPAGAQLPDTPAPTTLETVSVIGTNIVGARESGTLPVSVVRRESLDAMGVATAGEMIAALPHSGAQAFNNESQGPNQARGDVASANLRGLGSGNTLVLLNGRRMVAHPTTQQEGSVPVQIVNLNTVPGPALQRIDILRDGAGAIYGSDATAGILDNVLDNRFSGGEVTTRYGFSEGTALDEQSLGFKLGKSFNQGATHATLFGEIYSRSAMPASDRHYAGTDFLSDRVADTYASSFDNRSSLAPWLRASVATPVADFGEAFTAFHVQPCALPGSDLGTGTDGVCIDGGSSALEPVLRTDEAPERTLTPSSDRISLISTVEHDFESGVQAFGELLYYSAESTAHRGGTTNLTSAPLTISAANPYNPFGSGPGRDPGYTGPAQDIAIVGLRVDDVGRRRIDVDSEAYRALLGLRGELGDWWNWESAVLYSEANTVDVEHNRVSNTALQAALNSADPATAYNAFNGGNLAAPGLHDASLNPPAVVDPLRISISRDSRATLALADFKLSSPNAFSAFGRDVGAAVGVEMRRETFRDDRDPHIDGTINFITPAGEATSDAMGSSPTPDTQGSRNVHSAFAELQIPLISEDDAVSFARNIDLQLAARYERFSDIEEGVLKPKAALSWRLNDWLMFRGAYSEGFRAPNLETVNATEIRRVQENLTDLYGCAQGQGVDSIAAIDRSACGAYTYNVEDVRSGNRNLESETSETVSVGIVLNPTDSLALTLDWWRIRQDGIIGVFEAQDHLNLDAVRRLEEGGVNPALTRDADGQPVRIANQFLNLDSRTVEGVDIGALYALRDTRLGDFRFTLDIAVLDRFDQTPSPESASLLAAGLPASAGGSLIRQNENPRVRGSGSIAWRNGAWEANAYAGYVGSVVDTSALNYPVDDWLTVNSSLKYAFDSGPLRGTSLRIGVNNIADKDPPLADETFGYLTKLHNNRGRFWYLQVSKSFL
ncbi:TonB-dependent receptor [Luteimonas suaedae]|uniref:TonB-dependent receptor n=1 Tax=Luteimonas suaedae TaxID=2605430 RepID=UPI00165968C1|nr:TonB-dependent receptor [Luteimonas suaedae]